MSILNFLIKKYCVIMAAISLAGCGGQENTPFVPDPIDTCSIGGANQLSSAVKTQVVMAHSSIVNGSRCGAKSTSPVVQLLSTLKTPEGVVLGLCTGTLINPSAVLTAAHCVTKASSVEVRYLSDFEGNFQSVISSKWSSHPDYTANGHFFDVAIVHLTSSLPMPPVPLSKSPPMQGDHAVIMGYGRDSIDTANAFAFRSAQAVVAGVDESHLVSWFNDSQTGICFGDSGGPLFNPKNQTLWGVASYVINGCGDGSGHINLNHESVRRFIFSQTTTSEK